MAYKIICDVRGEIQMSHEYLGDDGSKIYQSQAEAQQAANYLAGTAADFGLHPGTRYTVVEVGDEDEYAHIVRSKR